MLNRLLHVPYRKLRILFQTTPADSLKMHCLTAHKCKTTSKWTFLVKLSEEIQQKIENDTLWVLMTVSFLRENK